MVAHALGKTALVEEVLVHVGDRAGVGIDARLAAEQPREPGARSAGHADADPRLQDGVAGGDPTASGVEARPVERVGQRGGEEARGIGLGLPLSRRLAGLLGGGVYAEANPGGGGRFVLRLPLKPVS